MDPSILGISWKRQLYHKWKSLRNVPFRKHWFVGYDLEGNSYWELIDRNNPTRLRRKVSFERPYYHFGDFKPHPMWMQWLQYTRRGPPTLVDLVNDMKRQHRMKLLAQKANEKWKTVPLKSSNNDTSDPRLASAWTGQGSPEPAAVQAQADEHSQIEHSGLNDQDKLARSAMLQAEEQIRRAPKVKRDPNGTTAASKKASSGPQQEPGKAESIHQKNDDPETASFKPKARS